jgi:glycosyltransferase involved in cell wall biosynthesis
VTRRGGAGNRLRVLILVQNLPVPFDRRVWQEALALDAAGYEVHIVCPRTKQYPGRREVLNGIHVYRYSAGPEARRAAGYPVEYGIAILSMLRLTLGIRFRRRIHVVHICNPPDLLFLVALPLVAARARLIYDHHDATPELMLAKGQLEGGWLVRLTTLFERLTYRCAHVSIETNDSFRDIALRRGRMCGEDVFVVRSAPDMQRFAEAKPDEKWRRGRKHLAAYVGIMGSQDGLDYLVDAAGLIIRDWRRDDIQFVLVGAGPELPRLRERVASLGIGDHVEFTGLISSGNELGSVLLAADVCVCPDEANRMNEISTMNKIMEYMALGRPIVQFDVHEGRVSAGDASLYAARNDVASLAEGIIRLVDDSELGAKMGQIGRERFAAKLTWEQQVPKLLAAYKRALEKGGKAASQAEWGGHAAAPRSLGRPWPPAIGRGPVPANRQLLWWS